MMRSAEPVPGEPWPHDMTITVDDRPNALIDLLWIREAHHLQPRGERLPPLLADPPAAVDGVGVSTDARTEWEDSWPRIWNAVTAHAGIERDPHQFAHLQQTLDGSSERADLLRRMVGPTWRDEFGDDALADPSYDVWVQAGFDAHQTSRPGMLQDSPERRDLDALIAAWRAGLTKIITIPCRGVFAQQINANALLMTSATRAESTNYRQALATFGHPTRGGVTS